MTGSKTPVCGLAGAPRARLDLPSAVVEKGLRPRLRLLGIGGAPLLHRLD